jgi:hypothetical protein
MRRYVHLSRFVIADPPSPRPSFLPPPPYPVSLPAPARLHALPITRAPHTIALSTRLSPMASLESAASIYWTLQ